MITMNRAEVVAAIRKKLLDIVDEDHSMCHVAAQRGIYCRGFRRLTDEQLAQRYSWLLKSNPSMSREELEERANHWELARQIVHDSPIACDAQAMEKDTCCGWDSFDNATIARFYKDLVGEEIKVADPFPILKQVN